MNTGNNALALRTRRTESWIQEGRRMAAREGNAVWESIDRRHTAEELDKKPKIASLRAEGRVLVERRQEVDRSLAGTDFNSSQQLRELAQARIDLAWAIGLLLLNAVLAVFVLLAFGPWYLTLLLALLVLVTALPIEEFFAAHEEQAALREGLFLTLAVLALAAQFYLGSIRGLFLAALAPSDVGPTTQALSLAAPILRWGLGVLAAVSECICGYKLYRWRSRHYSSAACALRERERCDQRMVTLVGAVKAAEHEPEIRRHCRSVGAREYLAQQTTSQARAKQEHLRRAVIGAAIALLMLALLALAMPAFAEPAKPGGVVVLIDLTKSTRPNALTGYVAGVADVIGQAQAEDRLVVIGITDSFGRPVILLDAVLPEAGYLGIERRAAQERMMAQWRERSKTLVPAYAKTDVLGALALAGHLGVPPKHLVIFSDLRQGSPDLSIEGIPRINIGQALTRVQRTNGIPKLPGTNVYLLGVDPTGVSAPYFSDLKSFWSQLFEKAGGRVHTFSITNRVPRLRGQP